MKIRKGVLILLLTGCVFILFAQPKKPSKWNFASTYNPFAPFWLQTQVYANSNTDSLSVIVKVSLNNAHPDYKKIKSREIWKLETRLMASMDSKKKLYHHTFYLSKWIEDDLAIWFKYTIPTLKNRSLYLIVTIFDEEEYPFVKENCISFFGKRNHPFFPIYDNTGVIPITDTYGQIGQEIILPLEHNVQIQYLKFVFLPALPPMASSSLKEAEINLVSDSSWMSIDTSITFSKKGIYCFCNVDNQVSQCISVFESKFPKLSKARELADPIVYIASDDERRIIRNAQTPKLKLDDFWLNLGLEKDATKKNIRTYYSGVERANRFFTCFKEGWKTDQGLVYIVFGYPDEVYKSDSKETWYYQKTRDLPGLKFIFRRKQGPLGYTFFELERSPDYNNVYQYVVELWRKGQLLE